MAVRSPANRLTARVRGFNIIKDKSFRRGKFILASGRESDFYLDLKPTMFDPEGANVVAELVLERLKDVKVDYVGGMEVGAIPIVTAVSVLSVNAARPIPGFFVRKKSKDHGTRKLVDGVSDLSGKDVVIIDDVTTTGASAMDAVAAAREAGANVVLILSIVDRGEGAEEFYKAEGLVFDWLFHIREFLAAE